MQFNWKSHRKVTFSWLNHVISPKYYPRLYIRVMSSYNFFFFLLFESKTLHLFRFEEKQHKYYRCGTIMDTTFKQLLFEKENMQVTKRAMVLKWNEIKYFINKRNKIKKIHIYWKISYTYHEIIHGFKYCKIRMFFKVSSIIISYKHAIF